MNQSEIKSQNNLGSFKLFKQENNRIVLIDIISISLIVELLFTVLAQVSVQKENSLHFLVDHANLKYQFLSIVIYVLLLFFVYFLYMKFPGIIGYLSVSFVLFHKIFIFLLNTNTFAILLFWIIFSLLFARYYIDGKLVVIVLVSSYFMLIFGLLHFKIPIDDFAIYLWLMMASSIFSIIICLQRHKKKLNEFRLKKNQYDEYEENFQKLNFDTQTGFYTRYAIESLFKDTLSGCEGDPRFFVLINLENLQSCRDLLGSEKTSLYVDIFSRILNFLGKNKNDKIGRMETDEFVAILSDYKNKSTIENKLDRYNKLLKDEFISAIPNSPVKANFSYSIVGITENTPLKTYLKEAGEKITSLEYRNKNKNASSDFYKSYINYSSLFNTGHITAIVWLPEEGWPVAFVTENISVLLGHTTEEMISGKLQYDQLIHPDDINRIRDEILDKLKQRKLYFEQKYRIRKSDGTYIWIRDYNVPVWDEETLIQVNGYLYNVNSEVETEVLLGENNKRLNNVVEATNACIWEWNLHSGTIKYNSRFLDMTGYAPEEIQPYTIQRWKELLHPDDLPLFNGVIEEYLSGHRDHYDIICRIKHKHGNWIWIHDKGKIIDTDAEDKPQVMLGNLIDITHLKETEAMLYHSDKLSALGRLSGGIAHDMNNQLMKIQGTAEMAKIWDSKVHYRESLDTIETLCESASWIINQLMEYSGNHEYYPEICNITTILLELSKLLDHSFEKEIIVRTALEEKDLFISADQALLKKAFFNICFNAKEAMSHGGTLKISSKLIRAEKRFATYTGDLPSGNYIKIEFSDEGHGISEDIFDKIFEPFFSTKVFGTQGLGLAKVVSVVKEHKGGIQVWSKVDIGSIFSIFLPYVDTLSREESPDESQNHIKANVNSEILIIDDELMICELLSAYFIQNNWKSRYFTNPIDGIAYFQEKSEEIEFVILDKFMPELNGDRVLDELVSIKEEIRVLFISGFSHGIDENIDHKDNIAGYIQKPVKLDDLKSLIEDEFSQ